MPDIELMGATYPDVAAVDLPSGGGTARFYYPSEIKYAASETSGGPATRTNGLPYGVVDGTSTATAFTVTISGITTLYDGLCILVKNNVIASKADCTLNVNGLGAKRIHYNTAANSQITTQWTATMTAMFYYDSTRNSSAGAWVMFYGYDSNTNTIGYQVRSNSSSLPMTSIVYRYRLLFTSADGTKFVPANNSTSTNATTARTVCQDKINPFGRIVYYGTTASVAAGSRPSAANLWDMYAFTLGYSFQNSPNYVLTLWKPVYLKCAPQSDGSAIIDSTTPFVQDLPTTEDGKIYIHLGVAYSETQIELLLHHPVFWYKDGMIRPYTNASTSGGGTDEFVITFASASAGAESDVTQNEIYEAAVAGKQMVLMVAGVREPVLKYTFGSAGPDKWCDKISSESFKTSQATKGSSSKVTLSSRPSGVFIVKDVSGTLNKTYSEIYTAFMSDGQPVLINGGTYPNSYYVSVVACYYEYGTGYVVATNGAGPIAETYIATYGTDYPVAQS